MLGWMVCLAAGIPPVRTRADCVATAANPLGPFYRRLAPYRAVLAGPEEAGTRLHLTGRVLATDRCTPVTGAIVDCWHANTDGRYYDVDSERTNQPGQYRLRGRLRSDGRGRYALETVLPGHYAVGRFTRPRHLHFIIQHPELRGLVTQVYFADDPFLARDPLVRDPLITALHPRAGGAGAVQAQFDFVIE